MWRVYLLLVALTACLALFFHQGRSWNGDSRLLTVYAIVEAHGLRADRWRGETGDYADIGGHIYSDKAPVSSFVTVPAYWAWRRFVHRGPQNGLDREAANHFALVLACAIPFGVFTALVFGRVRRVARSPAAAVWITLLASLGTCLANYASIHFGHVMAVMFLIAAYSLAVDRERHFALAGLSASLSVLSEYPLVVIQGIVCVYLALGPHRVRRLGAYLAGATPGAVAMMLYNRAITGKLFDLPYSHVSDDWAPMKTAFGLRLPSASATWELLFGQYRGLACYAPTLLLFVPLIVLRFDGPRRRRRLVIALLVAYVLFISSYFKWDGGWCVGPRHLAPVIALATYEGAAAFARSRGFRIPFLALAAWGMAVWVSASATDSIPAESFREPVFEVFFARALRGEISDHAVLFEWGMRRGGYLFAIWAALFVASGALLSIVYHRALRRQPAS